MHRLLVILPVVGSLFASPLAAQQDLKQRLNDIVGVSSLERENAEPYHLKFSFQLYDLYGKPTETGVLEQYWTPKHSELTIQSPSYSFPDQAGTASASLRNRYLINELLRQITNPFSGENLSTGTELKETALKDGKIDLSCLRFVLPQASNGNAPTSPERWSLCTQPGENALRIMSRNGDPVIVRNTVGTFRGVKVGITTTINYLNHPAITGHIQTLETFHPDAAFETHESKQSPDHVSEDLTNGHVIQKPAPRYPAEAKMEHLSGDVFLAGSISKEGSISDLSVIASPDKSLSDSAVTAVRQWRYQPFLLKGQPTEVETIIVVHYRLGS